MTDVKSMFLNGKKYARVEIEFKKYKLKDTYSGQSFYTYSIFYIDPKFDGQMITTTTDDQISFAPGDVIYIAKIISGTPLSTGEVQTGCVVFNQTKEVCGLEPYGVLKRLEPYLVEQ